MTDEQYIKMVLALPEEFFSDWKYQNGDSILIFYDQKWNVHHIGDYELENGKIGTIQGMECEFYEEDGKIRPLPNQRQLQDIILNNWKKNAWNGYTYFQLVSEFRFWINDLSDEVIKGFIQDKTTIDEMWLMFLMHDLYKKTWDGEAWV